MNEQDVNESGSKTSVIVDQNNLSQQSSVEQNDEKRTVKSWQGWRVIWLSTWLIVMVCLSVLYVKDRTGQWPEIPYLTENVLKKLFSDTDRASSRLEESEIASSDKDQPLEPRSLSSSDILSLVDGIRLGNKLTNLENDPTLSLGAQSLLEKMVDQKEQGFELTQAEIQNHLDEAGLTGRKIESLSLMTEPNPELLSSLEADERIVAVVNQPEWDQMAAAGRVAMIEGKQQQFILILLATDGQPPHTATAVAQPTILRSSQSSSTNTNFPLLSNTEILLELNSYRAAHQVPALLENQLLCRYAEKRVNDLIEYGGLDNHEGFRRDTEDFESLPPELKEYTGGALGENLAFQYCKNMTTGDSFIAKTPQQLIEWCFDSSTRGHREAQLNSKYTAACVRNGQGYFVVIFGE